MHTNHLYFKLISVALAFVLVFTVATSDPIGVKAATNELDYIETSLSVSEVQALCTGAGAVTLSIILVIVGFIIMTYCTLRNVQVPVQYDSTDSFFSKCTQLGQYAFDTMTEPIKNVFYSVKSFCDDHPEMNTITAIAAFTALNVASLFRAITLWFNSSFVSDRSQKTQDVLEMLAPTVETNLVIGNEALALCTNSEWSYAPTFVTLNYNSNREPVLTIGDITMTEIVNGVTYFTLQYSPKWIDTFSNLRTYSANGYCFVFNVISNSTQYDVQIAKYRLNDNGQFIRQTITYQEYGYTTVYNTDTFEGVNPSSSTYSTPVLYIGTFDLEGVPMSQNNRRYNRLSILPSVISSLLNCGISLYTSLTGTLPSTLNASDVTGISETVISPPVDIAGSGSDVVSTPDQATWDIGQIARDVSASALTLEQLKELLKNGASTISLESAITEAITMPSGSYNVPSLDGVWKYPRYMFATLGSYITFVGSCIQSVTVGEGGLSWLFFGAFVLLVCGGVIGKMLL